MGPSNSGKSTLAVAISKARGLPVVHLDQLYHQPHTNWVPRPADEFARLHGEAIKGHRWVIDGNYSRLLPQRLDQATGFILIDLATPISLYRYLRRCWLEKYRAGGLEGSSDRVQWNMIHHIAVTTRARRKRYPSLFESVALPKVWLHSPSELVAFYELNGLMR